MYQHKFTAARLKKCATHFYKLELVRLRSIIAVCIGGVVGRVGGGSRVCRGR